MTTWQLMILLAAALVAVVAGIRIRQPLLALVGFGVAALVAFGHLTARFGLEQIWFRAPTFYIAIALVLAGVV